MTEQRDDATRVEMPFRVLVHREEPDFEKNRARQTEYEFTGRKFAGNPTKRGAYSPTTNDGLEPA